MKRIISLLLTVVLLVTMTTTITTTVFAEGTATKSIMLGTNHITGGQASNVYFGTYQQSSDGNGGYNIDPIKWRVLSNVDGKLFLLSDQNLDVFRYHEEDESVTWETSTMRSWLNGLANNKGNGENAIDYTNDNFLDTAFSPSEQAAIADTTVVNNDNPSHSTDGGNITTDKVFLLSIEEAQNTAYGFTNNINSTDTRKATNTAYVAEGGKIGTSGMNGVGKAARWWLRSPGHRTNHAAFVTDRGFVDVFGYSVNYNRNAVRPAFNINLSSVLFTSAAKGGKPDGFNAVDDYSGTDWKLTFLDSSRSAFEATFSSISNNTVTVSYSGAKTGDNEYISALITDANGNVTYYGRLKNVANTADTNGTVEIDLSGKLYSNTKLYIFNEQYNGDYKTDYASNLVSVDTTGADYIESTTITYSVAPTYTVTIPATVELGKTATISAENVVIEKGTQVEVSLTGTSEDDNTFKLKTQEGAEITYTVQNGNANVAVGDTVLTVNPDSSANGETTLSFIPPTDIIYAGEYTGTVTFTVSVEAAN